MSFLILNLLKYNMDDGQFLLFNCCLTNIVRCITIDFHLLTPVFSIKTEVDDSIAKYFVLIFFPCFFTYKNLLDCDEDVNIKCFDWNFNASVFCYTIS